MIINPIDKSNYFKGLLVLVGKDKEINQNESDLIKKIGNILGFNHDFVDKAIKNFFKNKYIIEDPPLFSNYDFAEIFIKDGIRIALINKVINIDQIKWLETAAMKNNLSKQWLFIELESLLDNNNSALEIYFEIQKYLNHLYDDSSFVY
ncbi:MAG: hypothetical protein WAM24_05845 [Ignavibacteriaceae bacterium]